MSFPGDDSEDEATNCDGTLDAEADIRGDRSAMMRTGDLEDGRTNGDAGSRTEID